MLFRMNLQDVNLYLRSCTRFLKLPGSNCKGLSWGVSGQGQKNPISLQTAQLPWELARDCSWHRNIFPVKETETVLGHSCGCPWAAPKCNSKGFCSFPLTKGRLNPFGSAKGVEETLQSRAGGEDHHLKTIFLGGFLV